MAIKYNKEFLDNYVGSKVGFLTILSHYKDMNNKHNYFVCKCDCGNIKGIRVDAIVNNNTKSCGCYKYNLKTGLSHSRLYPIWKELKSRCYNPKNKRYNVYGRKGIQVCDEWKNDFMAFRKWAYENGYDENAPRGKCTIDRIDNNGDYEPLNCRWVSYSRQQRNTQKTTMFEYKGITKPLIDWCEELNLPYKTIKWRYSKWGKVEKVLTHPISHKS